MIKVGNKVIKNTDNWRKNDFDSWGRGVGVGIVVESPFGEIDGEIDVRWPGGRCLEDIDQVIKIEDNDIYYLKNDESNVSFIVSEFGGSPFYSQYDQFLELDLKNKIWKSISFMFPTPEFPNVVTNKVISVLLRKNKLDKLNKL